MLSAAAFARLPALERAAPGARRSAHLIETLGQVRSNPVVSAILVGTVAFGIAADTAFTLAPEFTAHVFGGSDLFVGILVGSFGVGCAIGALAGPALVRGRQRMMPAALLVEAVGIGLPAVSWNGAVAIVGMLLSGIGLLAAITRSATRLQLESETGSVGRVMAIWALCLIGPRPIMAVLDGFISDSVSPRVAAGLFPLPALAGAWYVNRALACHDAAE